MCIFKGKVLNYMKVEIVTTSLLSWEVSDRKYGKFGRNSKAALKQSSRAGAGKGGKKLLSKAR